MRISGLNQDITYWAPLAENQFGVRDYSAPILIKGRWEEKTEQFNTIGGQTIDSKAVALVDRILSTDGYLAQGDYTAEVDPTAIPTVAAEIQAFLTVPDLRSVTEVNKAVM